MNSLQYSNETTPPKVRPRLLGTLLFINFIALLVTFLLNFLGLPILKFHYLLHIALTLVTLILFDIPQAFPMIMTMLFIEGQGRILWEYASWSRVIFDILILIAILKVFITNKKIFNKQFIPSPLILFIFLHFAWYVVELFNIHSVSFLAVLGATKVYIYPLFLFLGLSQVDFKVGEKTFNRNINFFYLIVLLEIALNFFQFTKKQNFLYQISPYYITAMKNGIFTDTLFRPFATTHLPGVIAIYLFLTVGLLFLKKIGKKDYLLSLLIIVGSAFTIITCQVRSAFVKYFLILILIQFGFILYDRFRSRTTFITIITFFLFIFSAPLLLSNIKSTGDEGLDYAKDRIATLVNLETIKTSRLNLNDFNQIATSKLYEFPLGVGPGLTGAAGSIAKEELDKNAFLRDYLWASDNLFISLIIDFGIGAIFYILILLYIPTYFIRFIFKFYKNKNKEEYQTLLVCFCSIVVILIGNWGAIGINYNPESFIFWFYSALGFNTISKYSSRTCTV